MMNTMLMKVCRICLENSLQSTYFDIFDDMNGEQYYFSEFIETISHIKINKYDNNLPKWLCEDCANSLKGIFNFIITIQTTNEQLLENIHQQHEAIEMLDEKIIHEDGDGDGDGDANADKTQIIFEEFILATDENYKNEPDENSNQIPDVQLMEDIAAYHLESNLNESDTESQQHQQYEEEEHLLDDDNEQDNYDESYQNVQYNSNQTDCAEINDAVSCNLCKKLLKRKNLQKHLALHEKKRKERQQGQKTNPYLCAYCPRKFQSAKSVKQHEKLHSNETDDIIYVCGDCNRQYSTQFQLDNHRKLAHKERDNVCTICGNAFKLKNQLMNHMKLHLEKNITCPHCDKKYARQFDLNVHLRSHTGELPYSCHLCDKRFAIKVRLTYHLQKHYGIKHRCKECSAEFNSRQKLKAHTFKHTGMPYRCELCDNRGFSTRNVFKRHLNRVHNTCMSDETLVEMFQRNTGKTIKIKQVTELNVIKMNDDFNNGEEICEMMQDEKICNIEMDMNNSNVI